MQHINATKNVEEVKPFDPTINESNFQHAVNHLDSNNTNNANFQIDNKIYLPHEYENTSVLTIHSDSATPLSSITDNELNHCKKQKNIEIFLIKSYQTHY